MLVLEHGTGRIQYEAAPVSIMKEEYNRFWEEVNALLNSNLTIEEVFCHASLIHLIFVFIHPFADGNGRAGRLLEKWFLAEKLGDRAWLIQSEKHYHEHVNDYYRNLARIGMFYQQHDLGRSMPFLLMLPKSL